MASAHRLPSSLRQVVKAWVTLLICQVAAIPVFPQNYPGGTIRGIVADPNGRPIRVEVRLQEVNQQVVMSAYSDSTTGQFSFTNLRDTAYHVVINAESFRPVDTEVVIRSLFQQAVQVTIHLEYRERNLNSSPAGLSGLEPRTVDLKELRARYPKKALKAFDKGNHARDRGDLEQAVRHYQQALLEAPEFQPALTNLGSAYLQQHKLPEAEQAFKEAYRLEPTSAEACINLGHVYLETNRLAEAADFLRRAIERAPNSALAHFLMGMALAREGSFPAAEKNLKRAIDLDRAGMAMAYLVLANHYLKTGRWHEAGKNLQSYLSVRPEDPQASAIRQTLQRLQARQGSTQ